MASKCYIYYSMFAFSSEERVKERLSLAIAEEWEECDETNERIQQAHKEWHDTVDMYPLNPTLGDTVYVLCVDNIVRIAHNDATIVKEHCLKYKNQYCWSREHWEQEHPYRGYGWVGEMVLDKPDLDYTRYTLSEFCGM